MLKEAQRLYNLGFAVHWLKPNSKAPIKSGWSGNQRDAFDDLFLEYQEGYGLGVRMGEASAFTFGGYLANIDVDIKSPDPRHEREAWEFVEKVYPGLRQTAPMVKTGYGYRIFIRTPKPVESRKLTASPDTCEVHMPNAPINAQQKKMLTAEELEAGMRIRGAWEVELMSIGKQVVLPPTVHPDTKKEYAWLRPIHCVTDIPLIKDANKYASEKKSVTSLAVIETFHPVSEVNLDRLSEENRDILIEGTGVGDRSAAMLSIAMPMIRAGYSDAEILTALTDKKLFLGGVAYEKGHANTGSRTKAAEWVRKYTLEKAKRETDISKVFEQEVGICPVLEGEAIELQTRELVTLRDWRVKIQRSGKDGDGPPIKNLANVLTILFGEYGPELFKEDLFSGYRVFGKIVPWGSPIGEEFTDKNRALLSEWFATKWRFEPSPNLLYDAVVILAARYPFHPIRDYLESLEWDGKLRVDTWLKDYMGAHDVSEGYLTEVSRKVLVAMVKRALEPGCQFDYMLILKGDQGIKKSSALGVLAGQKYFSSTVLETGGKEAILKMASKWLIEFGELSTLKADIDRLKNFITTRVDRDRLPFDRLSQDFPRKCIFIGTTNKDSFLYDESGNRRYWPVSVQEVDLAALTRDRDQLFAEAKFLYEIGETLYLSHSAEAAAKDEQAKWAPDEDVLVDQIRNELNANAEREESHLSKFPEKGFKLFEIMRGLGCKDDFQTQRRVTNGLRRLGYSNKPVRIDGKNNRLWTKK